MDKFSIVDHGYSPSEVNIFLDKLIRRFEDMVKELSEKNDTISALRKERAINNPTIQNLAKENEDLKNKLAYYNNLEETLNKAILMAQKTADQMRAVAREEATSIVSEARNNANRIVNDALIKSEKVQNETDILRRNLIVFKKRLRGVIETQLDLVDDIEKIEI
jgi:cell division initiation protein